MTMNNRKRKNLEYPLNPEILRRNAELICEMVASKVDVDLFNCVNCKQSHLRFIAVDPTARKIIRTKYIPSTRSITSQTDPRTHITKESIIDDTGRDYTLDSSASSQQCRVYLRADEIQHRRRAFQVRRLRGTASTIRLRIDRKIKCTMKEASPARDCDTSLLN